MSSRTNNVDQRAGRMKCDLVLWEISSGLLDGVRDRLRGVQRIVGEDFVTERGTWLNRIILIASSASTQQDSAQFLAKALKTLALTHQPQQFLMVGTGACEPQKVPENPLVLATEILCDDAQQILFLTTASPQASLSQLPKGLLAEGQRSTDETLSEKLLVTTNWSLQIHEAILLSEIEIKVLVAVEAGILKEGRLQPPITGKRPQRARQLGSFLRQLWSQPKQISKTLKKPFEHWHWQVLIANQIESIINQLD